MAPRDDHLRNLAPKPLCEFGGVETGKRRRTEEDRGAHRARVDLSPATIAAGTERPIEPWLAIGVVRWP